MGESLSFLCSAAVRTARDRIALSTEMPSAAIGEEEERDEDAIAEEFETASFSKFSSLASSSFPHVSPHTHTRTLFVYTSRHTSDLFPRGPLSARPSLQRKRDGFSLFLACSPRRRLVLSLILLRAQYNRLRRFCDPLLFRVAHCLGEMAVDAGEWRPKRIFLFSRRPLVTLSLSLCLFQRHTRLHHRPLRMCPPLLPPRPSLSSHAPAQECTTTTTAFARSGLVSMRPSPRLP